MTTHRHVGVVGPSRAASAECALAYEVGTLLGTADVVVATGGLGGVMEAACRGAVEAGGTTIGLLPGERRAEANDYLTVAIPTGMGEMRNALLVRSCDALISVGGSWGTLSEVALACRTGVSVVALAGWDLPARGGPVKVATPAEAVRRALAAPAAS